MPGDADFNELMARGLRQIMTSGIENEKQQHAQEQQAGPQVIAFWGDHPNCQRCGASPTGACIDGRVLCWECVNGMAQAKQEAQVLERTGLAERLERVEYQLGQLVEMIEGQTVMLAEHLGVGKADVDLHQRRRDEACCETMIRRIAADGWTVSTQTAHAIMEMLPELREKKA